MAAIDQLIAQGGGQQFDPLAAVGRVTQLQNLRLQGQTAQTQNQTAQLENQQRQNQLNDQQAMTAAMHEWDGKDYNALIPLMVNKGASAQAVMGMKAHALDLQKQYSDIAAKDAETGSKHIDTLMKRNDLAAGAIGSVMSSPDNEIAPRLLSTAQQLAQNGLIDPEHVQIAQQLAQMDPASIRQHLDLFRKDYMANSAQMKEAQDQSMAKAAQTRGDAAMISAQKPTEATLAVAASKGDQQAQSALKVMAQQKLASRPVNNIMTGNDAKDIASAIVDGSQPPTLQGLYRNAAPVRAELARQGFNLSQAESDWKAVQKHLATMNGSQQLRIQQAISTASESLDKIEGLYNEWQQIAPTSGFKVLNKASLAAMKNMPGRAGAVAQALDANISDLTSELGVIYMGGNSPTDHGLGLAKQNLSADWNDVTFREGLKQARANIGIRRNSILNSQAVGVSANSPYVSQPQQQQPSGGSAHVIQIGNKHYQYKGTGATDDLSNYTELK